MEKTKLKDIESQIIGKLPEFNISSRRNACNLNSLEFQTHRHLYCPVRSSVSLADAPSWSPRIAARPDFIGIPRFTRSLNPQLYTLHSVRSWKDVRAFLEFGRSFGLDYDVARLRDYLTSNFCISSSPNGKNRSFIFHFQTQLEGRRINRL